MLLGWNECILHVEGHEFGVPGAECYGLNCAPHSPHSYPEALTPTVTIYL